jgi:hypothetical protein
MRNTIIFLFALVFHHTFGQLWLPIQYDTTLINQEIILSGDNSYNSTSLRNSLADRLFRGGKISDDVINNSYDAHNGLNRLGKNLQTEIEYRNYKANIFGNKNWGFLVKGGYYLIGSAAYSDDLFGLVFKGNNHFLGSTAEFSGTTMNVTEFQKVGFGVISKKGKSSITLNFVNVSNIYKGQLRTGLLTQDVDASSIDLEVDGSFSYTDKNQFSNGMGAVVDLDFKIPFQWLNSRKAYIQLQAKNLGVAYMNQGVKRYNADSTYSYSGFNFEQIFNNQSLFGNDFSILDSLQIQTERKKNWVALPCVFQAAKLIDENYQGKLQTLFGLRLYPTLSYTPLLYLGFNYRPAKYLDLGIVGSYGGFGGFRAGFYSNINLQKIQIGIGTEDFLGFISKNAFGESLNLRVRCKL